MFITLVLFLTKNVFSSSTSEMVNTRLKNRRSLFSRGINQSNTPSKSCDFSSTGLLCDLRCGGVGDMDPNTQSYNQENPHDSVQKNSPETDMNLYSNNKHHYPQHHSNEQHMQQYQPNSHQNYGPYSESPPPPNSHYNSGLQQKHSMHFPHDEKQQNIHNTNLSPPPPQLPTDDYYGQQNNYNSPSHHPQQERSNPVEDNHHTDSNNINENHVMDLSQFNKDTIFSGLKRMYRKKILPLELSSKYGHFHSPPLSPSDFEAKPMVLLLGQYSVGKTSFIKYMLGNRDFPGIRVGPEPTTDRFVVILQGESDKIVPGAALCSQADKPFRGLSPFGNNFLSRFEGVEIDAPILHNITLVDTPGILAGQKQAIGRNYDYEGVMKWFAERADLIIIMFDAHKLDISDELKRVIELMKPHADKLRFVLNKADNMNTQSLLRVYGALMWSLGKVMLTPEACRVYIGSFWGGPLKNTEQAALLNQEKIDLFHDISQLPQNAVMRRINELVKRARSVKVHAYIIHYLRKQLPYTFGKREKQRKLIDRLDREFIMCARRYELPKGDFPPLDSFRQALLEIKDLSEFSKLDKKMVKEMDKVFSVEIPELLERSRQF